MNSKTWTLALALLCSAATSDAFAQPKHGPAATTPPASNRGNNDAAPAVGKKVGGTRAPWERTTVTQADWLLNKQLSQIQHMRDVAQHNGNTRMLEQADKLEALARRQHAIRQCRANDDDVAPATP
jgi:TolA-binding protein